MIEMINTKRLHLRKVQSTDWEILYHSIKSKEFPIDLPLKENIKTESDAQQWIRTCMDRWENRNAYTWTILLQEVPKKSIGQILIRYNEQKKRWSISFWLNHNYQGKGYAQESVKAVLDNSKETCDIIWAGAGTWNKPSNNLLLNSGFTFVETKDDGYPCNGKIVPVHLYKYVLTNDTIVK